jgi:hypothetical protein
LSSAEGISKTGSPVSAENRALSPKFTGNTPAKLIIITIRLHATTTTWGRRQEINTSNGTISRSDLTSTALCAYQLTSSYLLTNSKWSSRGKVTIKNIYTFTSVGVNRLNNNVIAVTSFVVYILDCAIKNRRKLLILKEKIKSWLTRR